MLRSILFILGAVSLLSGQKPIEVEVKSSTTSPRVNQKVKLEVTNVPQGAPGQIIQWTKVSGEGSPEMGIGATFEFTPTKPGDEVKIFCQALQPYTGSTTVILRVAQDQAPPARTTSSAQTAPATKENPPLPPQQLPKLPAGFTKLASIVDPSKALVVPSGYMGDARPELGKGVSRLNGGADCKFEDGECYSISYNMAGDVPQGFTAYAWQVLKQGTSYNFGETDGTDLSRAGFRSLRLYAKAAADSEIKSPKVEFKSGGNIDPKYSAAHQHTSIVSNGPETLNTDWKEICLDLSKSDLRDVVSPLTVVISSALNPPRRALISIDVEGFSKEACRK